MFRYRLSLALLLILGFASTTKISSFLQLRDSIDWPSFAYKGKLKGDWIHYETFDTEGFWFGWWDGECYHGDYLILPEDMYEDSEGIHYENFLRKSGPHTKVPPDDGVYFYFDVPDYSDSTIYPPSTCSSDPPGDGDDDDEESEPSKPSLPSKPSKPSKPSLPSKPSKPSIPSRPSRPSKPSEPSLPSKPSEPSLPSLPSKPSLPSLPSEPSLPSKPSEPSHSDTHDDEDTNCIKGEKCFRPCHLKYVRNGRKCHEQTGSKYAPTVYGYFP